MAAKKKATATKTAAKKAVEKSAQETAAQKAAAERKLASIAREVDVRFEKAGKADEQADNHRLAAALQLEEARKVCSENGIKFAEWVEKNVKYSIDEARKLTRIAQAPDPALALADMRNRNRVRNQQHRAKQKAAKTKTKTTTEQPTAAIAGPENSPADDANTETERMLYGLGEADAVKVMKAVAGDFGLVLVGEDVAAAAKQQKKAKKVAGGNTLDEAKFAFDALDAGQKLRLLEYVAGKTGATITIYDQPIAEAVKKLG